MFEYDRLALDVAQQFAGSTLFKAVHQQRASGAKSPNIIDSQRIEENLRHLIGDSNAADIFDCGSSSGYGSPGLGGTPLASPAPINGLYLSSSFYEELGLNKNRATSTPIGIGGQNNAPASDNTPLSMSSSTDSPTGCHTPSKPPPAAVDDGFSPDEIAQFAELLCSPKKMPPSRYQCHICYNTGHYISDCPMRFNTPYEELTPYQGRKKCYGEFTCQQCKRRWTSQNSVANEAQSCIKCHVPVFPHKQLPVDKAVALGLVKAQRTVPTKVAPIGFGRPPLQTAAVRP